MNIPAYERTESALTVSLGCGEHRRGRGFPQFVILYATLYAGFGAASPFLPPFLQARGLPADQIGFVLAAGTAVRLIAGPAAGQIADRMRAPRITFAVCTTCAAAFALTNLTVATFWSILLVSVLWSATIAPAAPLADALALAAAERNYPKGFEYGWVRGAGSAAFILGTIIAGQAVYSFGLGATLVLQAALLMLAAIWIGRVPNYVIVPQITGSSSDRAEHDSVWELLRIPVFRQVILVAALVLGSHALHDSFAVIRWNAEGIGATAVSVLWSEQVIAEVAVFLVIGPALLRWFRPALALTLSAGAAAIRWAVMAISTDPYILAVIEPLHGLSFALLHLASMRIIAVVVPLRLAATAQTIYGTVGVGAAVALMTIASGLFYQHLGGLAFWIMVALCLAAIPLAMNLRMPH